MRTEHERAEQQALSHAEHTKYVALILLAAAVAHALGILVGNGSIGGWFR
jgi:hypothetical protein